MNALERLAGAFWRLAEYPFREVVHAPDAQCARLVLLLRAFYAWLLLLSASRAGDPTWLSESAFPPIPGPQQEDEEIEVRERLDPFAQQTLARAVIGRKLAQHGDDGERAACHSRP